MSKVAVIGIGDVGATLAYSLQISGLATEIVLIDANKDRANGNALDMNHGLFFLPPVKLYAGDFSDCQSADIIVFAAGARQKPGETRLQLVQRNDAICKEIIAQIKPYIQNSILLITTNPVDVMTYTVLKTSGLPANQVIGSGTVLDSARFRYNLSQRCLVDPRNVHAYVIGEHGDSEVLLWSSVNISGVPLQTFCQSCDSHCEPAFRSEIEELVKKSAYHIIEAKGFTNYGVSQAVVRIIEAILRNERSMLTVSTFLNGEYGLNNVCLSAPCLVGNRGVDRIVKASLATNEEKDLTHSAEVIQTVMKNLGYL
jgi:L-lactate dehydrogenase